MVPQDSQAVSAAVYSKETGSGNAKADRKIGDEGFLFHAVAVSERVSVEEHVMQNGRSVDAGKEKNAEAPPRCTIGVLVGKRAALASLAYGKTRLTNALFSDDSRYFAGALQTLGFDIQLNEYSYEMTITGLGGKIPSQKAELFIGNAGTAARFLSAFLTLGHGEYILDGDSRMRERPIGDLIDALAQLGAALEATNHCPPVKIKASGLPGGKTEIAGNISSQFLSALLVIAPYANSQVQVEVTTELNSKPYVDMTVLPEFR